MSNKNLIKKLRKKFTPKWLYAQYILKRKSILQISKENRISVTFVRDRLLKYKIKIRTSTKGVNVYLDLRKNRKYRNKKWLKKQYTENKKSMPQLAHELNVSRSAIRHWLKIHKISSRPIGGAYNLKKKWLINEYTKKRKYICEISKETGVSNRTISKYLKSYGIRVSRKKRVKKFIVNEQGYIYVWKPNHSNSTKRGYIFLHRYLMSKKLQRPLKKYEIVHHKDGDRKNNKLSNLELLNTKLHPRGFSMRCPFCKRKISY